MGTEARTAEEEPTKGMRSQGGGRQQNMQDGFSEREEWLCQTVWGGGEARGVDSERSKSVGNEARTDEVEGCEWTPDSRGITSEHRQ